MPMRFTAPTARRPPKSKSAISSRRWPFTAADCADRRAPRATVSMINLLDLDTAGLTALFTDLGEKPFRARQVSHWLHQRLIDDVGAMTDLAKPLRERLAAVARDSRPARRRRHDGGGRHAQMAARRRRRQRRRGRLYPGRRPRHAVHLVAGRLRARLRVLLDRQAGIQPQSDGRRNRRPALARQPGAGRGWRDRDRGSNTAARRSPTW